jgi:hypothetical protein
MQSFDQILCFGALFFSSGFTMEHILQAITGFAIDKGGNRLAKGDLLTVWQLDLLAIGLLAHESQSLFALIA